MKSFALLAFAGFTTLVTAYPGAPSRTQKFETRQSNSTSTAPCAQVSQYMYQNLSAGVQLSMPAELAWNCINSVPFNVTSGKRLIQALRPYVEWQSTIEALKNPPAEYAEKVQPATDILGGLDQIDADIDANQFKNEYDFGMALYTLILSAHDGHFSYIPDSVGTVFNWGRPVPLVSVSADGTQLPSVFVFADVLGMQYKNISYTPSPVVEIDGTDVTEFLEDLSQYAPLHDRDASYNNLFYELAQVKLMGSGSATGLFTGGGRGRYIYPGANTTLTFANGTTFVMQNYARAIFQDFRNVTSGETLAKKVFNYATLDVPIMPFATVESASVLDGLTAGYPDPVMSDASKLISGFYIKAPGYEDVAVLSVPNFVGSNSRNFQAFVQKFLPQARADGKTKLIVDLQANGGGIIGLGYDMFKQLFPNLDPYGASRVRATEAGNLIGQTFSAYASQHPPVSTSNQTQIRIQSSYFDYQNDMTVDAKPFTSWSEKYGPVEADGGNYMQLASSFSRELVANYEADEFTTTGRWNLSDTLFVKEATGLSSISGYGVLANLTGPPPFMPEDVVLVTDGYCASTCTIFSELMMEAGIKTIVMGGRSNKDPMQAIGGVRGAEVYQYNNIRTLAQSAVKLNSSLSNSVLGQDYSDLTPLNRASSPPTINFRDAIREGDDSGIAFQFEYEAADCRLYYTPEMTVDISSLWRAAADAKWSNSGKCVSGGGYGQKRSTHEMTDRLTPRRIQVSQAVAVQQVQAFEDTFSLETDCKVNGDGFVQP